MLNYIKIIKFFVFNSIFIILSYFVLLNIDNIFCNYNLYKCWVWTKSDYIFVFVCVFIILLANFIYIKKMK